MEDGEDEEGCQEAHARFVRLEDEGVDVDPLAFVAFDGDGEGAERYAGYDCGDPAACCLPYFKHCWMAL